MALKGIKIRRGMGPRWVSSEKGDHGEVDSLNGDLVQNGTEWNG